MPAISLSRSRLLSMLAACALVAGCGSFGGAGQRLATAVTPYKMAIVQGNFVSREQVEFLKPGLTRQQVREVLGTPLLASAFHTDRWDYVFTLRRQGTETQAYRLTVVFKGDALERFEGDAMPTEAEFVTLLDVQRRFKTVPVLEASEAQLKRFPAPQTAPAEPPQPPARASYPPLEPAAR